MKKAVTFSEYKAIQKLSFNDFNRWITEFYGTAYVDGMNEICKDCVAALTDEHLMEIILSVKGIGKNRATAVVNKIMEEGISYGTQT